MKIKPQNKDGALIECISKESIEEGILREIERPFLKIPLVDMVGLLRNTETTKIILEGKFQ